MHPRAFAPLIFLAASAAPLYGTVVVHQVEASESSTVQRYAPLDFAGSATRPGTGAFAGITFHALDTLTDTFSNHANAVGSGIYGSGSAGNPFVTNVYNDSVDHFYTAIVKAQTGVGIAPAPGMFGNSTKVSNHSYVGTFASSSSPPDIDKDGIRRLDFMINREDVLLAAGAVADTTPGTQFYHNNLAWAARNAVAVRGNQTFDPAGGTLGRQHADLWFPADASYATSAVSGFAAGLIGTAQSLGYTSATHNVTAKSLLMTGADAPPSATLANHLDPVSGAGQANYAKSLSILQGGERPVSAVTTTSGFRTTATPAAAAAGFAYGTAPLAGYTAILFTTPQTVTGLAATLNWNVTSPTTSGGFNLDTRDASLLFSDLGLRLASATLVGGQYVLTPLGAARFGSDVVGDNVEHLSFQDLLPAGTYALLVRGDSARATTFGFSYSASTSAAPLLLGDANWDGRVDAADLAILRSHLGSGVTGGYSAGDFNFDDVVNADDFTLFQQGAALYAGVQSAAVPEPAVGVGLALFFAGSVFGLRRRVNRRP